MTQVCDSITNNLSDNCRSARSTVERPQEQQI